VLLTKENASLCYNEIGDDYGYIHRFQIY
jgi:hypothetical protein